MLSCGPPEVSQRRDEQLLARRDGVAELSEDEAGITVDEDGQLRVEALIAESEPSSLIALRAAVSMLPQVELPEVLLEVATWTGFHQAFTPFGGSTSGVKNTRYMNAGLEKLRADGFPSRRAVPTGRVLAWIARQDPMTSFLAPTQSRLEPLA